jgi:hypothetical protein
MNYSRILILVVGATACGGGTDSLGVPPVQQSIPDPGFVDVRLSSPNVGDRGILFSVSGAPVDTVQASGALEIRSVVVSGATIVILRGAVGPGIVARVRIADRNRLSQYSASVLQAVGSNYEQRGASAYRLDLVKSP